METIYRFSLRLAPISLAEKCLQPRTITPIFRKTRIHFSNPGPLNPEQAFNTHFPTRKSYSSGSSPVAKAGWVLGLGEKKKSTSLPDIVKAGDPVLHEPAQDVEPGDIGSERIQKIIDDMVKVMRKAPGVGLAAPQIGIPLRIIVLEDTKEYISYAPKEETAAQDRRPFDLLVILNPKLQKKSNRTAVFFEGCLSVDGFRAVVERNLDVEVSGFDRNGQPIKISASGWQARILQHECDHLEGTLYVDKMVPRTFRTVENLDLPLAEGCPKLGGR
ncbi:peptide deformylase 1A, chloroplastic/mitochondrial [Prunus avium]|uniref:Peptide deformylase n=1 Tax=Prunus avium TaxID=42229 RepID=A0A6P5RSI2_PRUAV|nr:peptide deformylase 1A, chloroplastic/mitochondrial [Prunus avium]XP_021806014.1 peptide deformylase 1A, chloroplastic/mitochondrial [Prunus avium]